MNAEKVLISSLVLDPSNARIHDKKNIEAIKGSLAKFGQQKNIVVDSNNIVIAGNGTVIAARELGWTEIWINRTNLEGIDRTAFALADNRTAELAEWDDNVLGETLHGLRELDFDLSSIGFDTSDLDNLGLEPEKEGLTDPDDVPEVEQNIHGVKRGQIWQLGSHRLMCGDSTSKDDVEKLMNGEKADMVFTSPPYADLRDYGGSLDLDTKTLAKIFNIPAKTWYVNLGIIIRNREIVPYWQEYVEQAKERGLKLLSWNVWDKGNASAPAHQQAMFGLCHEWIFVFGEYRELNLTNKNKLTGEIGFADYSGVRKKDGRITKHKKKIIREFRQLDSVIRLDRQNNHGGDYTGHPAQFPVILPEEYINAASSAGEIVCDPFLGSGSTLIACEKTGRKCYGMEISEDYCSVIITRWENFTGKKAVLNG